MGEPRRIDAAGGVNLYTGKRIVGNPTLKTGEYLIAKLKGEVK
jgi:hypothetical protein